MDLHYFSLIIYVTTIYNCLSGSGSHVPENPSPLLTTNILNAILQNKGTSQKQIINKLVEANGDQEKIINGINSELRENLLQKHNDLIRIKHEGLKNIVTESVQSSASNSFVGYILKNILDEGLTAHNENLETWAANNSIPVGAFLNSVSDETGDTDDRKKRSVEQLTPRTLDLIGGAIQSVLQFILGPVNNIVKTIISSILNGIYPTVGYLVLTPVRLILEWLIDTLLPCSGCAPLN
jgi:hypothetical protein